MTTETFLISDGRVSFIAHDRPSTVEWAMVMIERGLAPQVTRWSSL